MFGIPEKIQAWKNKRAPNKGAAKPVTASPAKPPKKPKGFIEAGDVLISSDRAGLVAYAAFAWGGTENFDVQGPSPKSKLYSVVKKKPAVQEKAESGETVPTAAQIKERISAAVENRPWFETVEKLVKGLGTLPPDSWWKELEEDLGTSMSDVKGNSEEALILAVLVAIGKNMQGNKRVETILKFIAGVPEEQREMATAMFVGGMGAFFLAKKAAPAAAQPTKTGNAVKAAPPPTTPPEADDGTIKLA